VRKGKLTPPSKILPLNPPIENQIHRRPTTIINPRRRRHIIRPHENQRPIYQPQPIHLPTLPPLLPNPPSDHRHESTNPEEVQQARIDLAERVDARGPDGAPDDGGGEDGAAVGAGEAVGLVRGADFGDVVEHPEGYADLG
jgi:hypothetical protein